MNAVAAAGRRLPAPDPNWALFLDLDGTLVDIAARPDLVHVPDALGSLLTDLAAALGGALALVSGRSLDDLDRVLSPWRAVAAGEHGASLRLPAGRIEAAPALPDLPRAWRDALGALEAAHPGVVVEQKSASVAVHFRLAPAAAGAARDAVARLAGERPDEFASLPGNMLVELRPRAVDKGWAVRRLMREQPFTGRTPIFVGDDVTDEDGFRAARALGGIGLHVQQYFPAGTAGVREWLVDVLAALRAQSPA